MSQYQPYGGSQYPSAPDGNQYGASNQYGGAPTQSLQAPAPPSNRISTISQTSHYSQPATAPVSNSNTHTVYSQQDFLASIDSIRRTIIELSSNISQIGTLHQRGLTDPSASSTTALESAVTQTQILSTQIRDRIKALELDAAKTPSASADKKTKLGQVKALKAGFERELESYRQEERAYLLRYREQIARQYRIVNPGASEAEVEEARNADWGDEGVFQTALRSNRSGAANSVLGAVRARHTELKRMETTLEELAQMFEDLAQAVEVQEVPVTRIERDAEHTLVNLEGGNKQLDGAVGHAKNVNKLKRWLLLVVILIVCILALVLGLVFGLKKP